MDWTGSVVLFAVTVLAGAVNAVAGGGTLLTFPALLWAGQLEIVANATSTVALWPGQLGSLFGYRRELGDSRRQAALLAIPSFVGGLLGAALLLATGNELFSAIVPYLILAATLLFLAQEPISRWLRRRGVDANGEAASPVASRTATEPSALPARWLFVLAAQLMVGIYGGYFGAGIGILMLAALGFLGLTNIHQMNALKNINGMCINGIAAAIFIAKGLVDWRLALWMALAAVLGGYGGALLARFVGQRNVRRAVIVIGLALTAALLARQMGQP